MRVVKSARYDRQRHEAHIPGSLLNLKKRLESVAASEGRSVAQICEAFLHAGLVKYEKEGTKYVQRFLARPEQEP